MKKENIKTGWMALLTLLMMSSTSSFAQTMDHGAGNGNGGLDLGGATGSSGITDDVTVPIPSALGQRGTLMVTGTPGEGQSDQVYAAFCKVDDQGQILKYGCGRGTEFSLNEAKNLLAGRYEVFYGRTYNYVTIIPNQATTISLAKIQVADDLRSIVFRVFDDYSNSQMAEKIMIGLFSNADNQEFEIRHCSTGAIHADNKLACEYEKSNSLKEYTKNLQLNQDGSFSQWDFNLRRFDEPQFRYLNSLQQPGKFVSVLPGVYGIEFTDTQSGQIVRQNGIVAE